MNTNLAVFCDLDGTLVDTAHANHAAYRDALASFGVEFPLEVFVETWGRDSRDFLPEVAPGLTSIELASVRKAKADRYATYAHLTALNVPLYNLLVSMKTTMQVVLVTTAKRQSVVEILAHHGLNALFDHAVCGDDTERSKPWPDPYLRALEISGVVPENSVTFEDSSSGIESATRAGIGSIKVEFSSGY